MRPKALYLTPFGVGSTTLRGDALKLIGSTELNALVKTLRARGLRVDMHCDDSDDPLSRHVDFCLLQARSLQARAIARRVCARRRAAASAYKTGADVLDVRLTKPIQPAEVSSLWRAWWSVCRTPRASNYD